MGISLQPLSVASGLQFGTPTTFNTSGTYTIPSSASFNSTIMIESMGGGSGGTCIYAGNGASYMTYSFANYLGSNYNFSSNYGNGATGGYYLGVYQLGFLTQTPAGASVSVVIGAGGAGASLNTTTNFNVGANIAPTSIPNSNSAGTGGASYATISGVTIGSTNISLNTGTGTFTDPGTLNSVRPYGGQGINNLNMNTGGSQVPTVNAQSGGSGSKSDFYAANVNNSILTTNQLQFLAYSAPTTLPTFTDGAVGTGQGGQPAGILQINAAGTYNLGRAGNGAQPSGGGGGWGLVNIATGNYTFNAGQVSGSGGAGRVRIWFQA
jgi:hypothetical protein